jgi:hypothetical protein
MVGPSAHPKTAAQPEHQSGHFPELDSQSLPVHHHTRPTVFETQVKRPTVIETPAAPTCSPSDETPLPQDGLLEALTDTLTERGAVDGGGAEEQEVAHGQVRKAKSTSVVP